MREFLGEFGHFRTLDFCRAGRRSTRL